MMREEEGERTDSWEEWEGEQLIQVTWKETDDETDDKTLVVAVAAASVTTSLDSGESDSSWTPSSC